MSGLGFGSRVCLPGKGTQLGGDKKPELPSCILGWRTKDVSGTVAFELPSPTLPNQFLSPAFISKTNQNFFIEQTKSCLECAGFPSDLQGIHCLQSKLHLELSKITRKSVLSETSNPCSYLKSLTSNTTKSSPF